MEESGDFKFRDSSESLCAKIQVCAESERCVCTADSERCVCTADQPQTDQKRCRLLVKTHIKAATCVPRFKFALRVRLHGRSTAT